MEWLSRRIASSGVCSRRKASEAIREGRVSVNGNRVTEPSTRVGPEDAVEFDGVRLSMPQNRVVLALNKPKGYVSTMSDTHGRRTVMDLAPQGFVGLKPVGRLDKDTEGLLLFTNDGELANRLLHPRYELAKVYEVAVRGKVADATIVRLERGVWIEGGRTSPAKISRIETLGDGAKTRFLLEIHEGRKRQVRSMCAAVGALVVVSRRLSIGPIRLGRLPRGACRKLAHPEVEALLESVGLAEAAPPPKSRRRK
ncbi:MAG TPA: pseudouridine synthase [Fimbriimonadaceae bacterium]|nr:pseudouridine synthase [Fimbriimonadaceae bacterium]